MKFEVILVSCLFVAGGVFAAEPEPFVFAENGMAKAAVVIPKDAGPGVRHAAKELSDYLGKITGGGFAVGDRPVKGCNTILVGTPYSTTNRDEICIRVKDAKTLEVTGNGPIGTLYAVYDLLETCGCGFWAHDFETVATNADLSLPGGYKKVEAPWMTWRGMCAYLARHDFDYSMKLRLNNSNEGDAEYKRRMADFNGYFGDFNQTLTREGYVSRAKFFKDHPDWFAWNRHLKKYNPNTLCASNEEMYEELIKEVGEYLEKNYPKVQEVPLCIEDGYSFCECEKCLALSRSDNNPEKTEVPGVQVIAIVNRVAKSLAKKYPDVRFNALNYGWCGPTDRKRFSFEPNAGCALALLWRNFGLPCEDCERAGTQIERWTPLSKQGMYVWDYYANFDSYQLPFPDLDIMCANVKYYKRLGVRAVNPQISFTYCGNLSELYYWVLCKLCWNPDLDGGALVNQYLDGAYGKAAPFIRQYIDILIHGRQRQHGTWIGCYVPETSHFLTPEDCIQILRVFDQAKSAVRDDPGRRKMVHRASISPLTLVRYRYNDLIEPAKKQHYTLPPLEKFCADYNNVFLDSSNEYGEPCWSEDWGPELFFRKTATNAPVATAWPAKKSASVHIAAKDLTGGTRMTRERDPAGFDFCRIKVALNSEVENIWMNPGFAEIGYTVPPDQAGEWYVFATVRLGATVPRDPAAAYAGIYVPWFVNGVKYNDVNEIADLPLSGAAGEEGWQTLCLGRRILVPGSRIWVMPGTVYPTRFQDVKNFVLVDPAAFATNSANCLCADVRKMDGRGLARGYDAIDRFDYLRSTNGAPVAAKVTDKAAGDKMVFARVRIGASAPLDQEAAFISVTSGTGTNRATLATTRISGSPGDESWQVVCAGRLNLTTNMTLSVTAGTNHPPRFVDVRDFQIVKPELFGEK